MFPMLHRKNEIIEHRKHNQCRPKKWELKEFTVRSSTLTNIRGNKKKRHFHVQKKKEKEKGSKSRKGSKNR